MPALFLGLDIGTSGARAVIIDRAGVQMAEAKAAMADFGADPKAPATWWGAADHALRASLAQVAPEDVVALAVDGTSGSVLAVDADEAPLGPTRMYNDPCTDAAILSAIDAAAPAGSPARGASSALARALELAAEPGTHAIRHQADWIAWHLSGRAVSDANNALKTGYDGTAARWPDWIAYAGLDPAMLPPVLAPGAIVGPVTAPAARDFGLSPETLVVAGTTDGCASFIATGADQPGDGVTALGTTMTIKLLSDRPIFAPEYGIYSHRILGHWLAGGASNTGGNVLLRFFDADALATLSQRIDAETKSGLDYYPLAKPGERFPINDPGLAPRLAPRPDDDAAFLHGLFEGIAGIEALAYQRLAELGAPRLGSLRSVGGGAQNPVWTRLRERRLGVPMRSARSTEAAYGSARLAMRGMGT
ncbi:MAG: FGGY-family carbohydrate kinase [Pseudomonadota bacterium]